MTLNMLESSANFGFYALRFRIFTDSWAGENRFQALGILGFRTGFSGISGVSAFSGFSVFVNFGNRWVRGQICQLFADFVRITNTSHCSTGGHSTCTCTCTCSGTVAAQHSRAKAHGSGYSRGTVAPSSFGAQLHPPLFQIPQNTTTVSSRIVANTPKLAWIVRIQDVSES